MSATVIGTIESAKIAQKAIDELLKAGFQDQDVEILEGDEDEIVAVIVERGFGEGDARDYAKAVAAARPSSRRAPTAPRPRRLPLLWSGMRSRRRLGTRRRRDRLRDRGEFSVGKNKVASGGVRVTTHVSEQPVEQTVTLRDEAVEVERRPADRKLKAEEAEAAFQEKTVEMLGTSEEAKVSKEARVVGEVSLGKRVEERKETVKERFAVPRSRSRRSARQLASQSKLHKSLWALPVISGEPLRAPSGSIAAASPCPTARRPSSVGCCTTARSATPMRRGRRRALAGNRSCRLDEALLQLGQHIGQPSSRALPAAWSSTGRSPRPGGALNSGSQEAADYLRRPQLLRGLKPLSMALFRSCLVERRLPARTTHIVTAKHNPSGVGREPPAHRHGCGRGRPVVVERRYR